jgi:hypothetical protein
MDAPQHTPGPWRWEVNQKSKVVQLCGGKPQYDLTVMDFERWGMSGVAPRFRDSGDHGLLYRCLKWLRKITGREHHAEWLQSLDHPDANLIAAAPELLESAKAVMAYLDLPAGSDSDAAHELCSRACRLVKAAIELAEGGRP